MNPDTHWADIAMSIYDRIQKTPRVIMLYKDGDKVKTSAEGSALYGNIMRNRTGCIIGVYNFDATLDSIEDDILDAMVR